MELNEQRDFESIIDSSQLGRFQGTIIALCALVVMLDGFDTQAIGFVAPEIATAWHVAPSAFGVVFGAGIFGTMVGAMILGMAGDRVGRKPTLIFAMVLFGVSSLVTPLTETMTQLTAVRFLTGLGCGGALPNLFALTSEYAPKRLRLTLVGMVSCGFPLGAMLGGFASVKLIPEFGWNSVFIAGGILPLLVLPLVMIFLPESAKFLVLSKKLAGIERILKRLNGATAWNGKLSTRPPEVRAPVAGLFSDGRASGTFLLWITAFFSFVLSYFLVSWIPIVARQSGLSIETAVLALSMLNFGAVAGCLVVGRLADRFGPATPIACAFALGALAVASIGQTGSSGAALYVATFATGFLSTGAQLCTIPLVTSFYDTFLRATGVGWVMGVGRIGAIAGPVLGGMLLAAGTGLPTLFLVAALPSLGAALAVFTLGRVVLPRAHDKDLATARR